MKRLLIPVAAALMAFTPLAQASEQVKIGEFDQWTAYQFDENGGKVCYIVARPTASEPKGVKRGEIAVLITHRPAEGTKNVFTYMSGYPYKNTTNPENGVLLTIDAKKFRLFTQNDMAWAADPATDNALSDAIRKGNKMTVEGESARGTKTKDIYSLKGSTKAYEAIGKECGV